MERTGFLSPPASQATPKRHVRKCKDDTAKAEMPSRKMKVAKIEEVNRFTEVAAPSGLLDELNPGIINRLRNSEQVYSIIGALIRTERVENTQSKQEGLEI
ncbi:hypothetical protein CJ030_MR1G009149 [Morella rubra]|uniref:Uncharacterized protein n=1 Tax=Morella rubra TaxID=262757 RepID=A0A6A1WSA4_9ROSI|nr:hypothetical protein CJ030_MR1G009149 [Morella rubra]